MFCTLYNSPLLTLQLFTGMENLGGGIPMRAYSRDVQGGSWLINVEGGEEDLIRCWTSGRKQVPSLHNEQHELMKRGVLAGTGSERSSI